jgi:TP901 family phage tail tape measure protein
LSLLTASDESYKSLTEQMNNATGSAKMMADQMESGVGGSVRQLKSAWEGFTLALSGSSGVLKGLVDGLTVLVIGMSNLVK